MSQTIEVTLSWADTSTGALEETGQEIDIYTDSPSFVPNVPINYSEARHPWMRFPPIAAGETTAVLILRTPVTFVKFRVRQYNANGSGSWSLPKTQSVTQTEGIEVPSAPINLGLVVTSGGALPPPPPVDPPPPPPPTGGGGSSSNYDFQAQFSGVQGQSQWSYLDANNTPLTYDSLNQVWTGAQAYQGVWAGGVHPGTSVGTRLRYTVPSTGVVNIAGPVALQSGNSPGVTFTLAHNGSTVGTPQSLTTTDVYSINASFSVTAADTIDFTVAPISGNSYSSTTLQPVIQLTTDGVTPTNPTVSSLSPSSITLGVAAATALTVTLSSAPSSAAVVTLNSSDPTKATVPSSVTIPAGSLSTLIQVTGVASGGTVITATYNGTNKQSVITVGSPPSGAWQNAPIGGVVLADNNCSADPDLSPGFHDVYNGATSVQSDPTAPFSPPGCWRHRLEALAPTGGGQLEYTSGTLFREMYVGMRIRTNAQFQGRTAANKMMFLRSSSIQSNGFIGYGTGRLVNGRNPIVFAVNGGAANQHIFGPSSDSGAFFFPNVGPGVMTAGVWTKLEWRLRVSTNITSQDGVLQIWVDDVLSHNYQNINYSNGTGLNQWVWNQTWDGSGDMGTSNTVAWEYWIDHIYIVGKN